MNKEQQVLLDEAYDSYSKAYEKDNSVGLTLLVKRVDGKTMYRKPDKEMFIALCTHDKSFSDKWDLQIEEKELNLEKRYNLWFNNNYETGMERFFDPNNLPDFGDNYYVPTPTKLISVTYKGEKIEIYE